MDVLLVPFSCAKKMNITFCFFSKRRESSIIHHPSHILHLPSGRPRGGPSALSPQPSALNPQPSALNSQPSTIPIDHELITRATSLVEENLSTPNYTVERLAQDLCMDRTGLYKKMTAMLGKTPTVFMRSIRVNHAVQLIREGKLTMTEVAEQSGFSSASYMAKCFQEDLGKNPSDLRENQP